MSINTYQAKEYVKFLLKAENKFKSDNKEFSNLLNDVLNKEMLYYDFELLEKKRNYLLRDNRSIEVTDFGAGSKKTNSNTRLISEIAKNSLTTTKYSQLLFRLANKVEPSSILELGTSLGLQTAYFSKACPSSKIISFEGCPNIIAEAQKLHDELELKNISLIEGNMDITLQKELENIDKIDMAFIDGNHRLEATKRYCQLLTEKSHNKTIWILDDIHWSSGMTEAWNNIRKMDGVTASVDLFYMGMVFFDDQYENEHSIIKY